MFCKINIRESNVVEGNTFVSAAAGVDAVTGDDAGTGAEEGLAAVCL